MSLNQLNCEAVDLGSHNVAFYRASMERGGTRDSFSVGRVSEATEQVLDSTSPTCHTMVGRCEGNENSRICGCDFILLRRPTDPRLTSSLIPDVAFK